MFIDVGCFDAEGDFCSQFCGEFSGGGSVPLVCVEVDPIRFQRSTPFILSITLNADGECGGLLLTASLICDVRPNGDVRWRALIQGALWCGCDVDCDCPGSGTCAVKTFVIRGEKISTASPRCPPIGDYTLTQVLNTGCNGTGPTGLSVSLT